MNTFRLRVWLLRQSPSICFLLCCLACLACTALLVQAGVRSEPLLAGAAL